MRNFMKRVGIPSARDIVLFGWHIYMLLCVLAGMCKSDMLVCSYLLFGAVIPDKEY
jgi:hypothetical protein